MRAKVGKVNNQISEGTELYPSLRMDFTSYRASECMSAFQPHLFEITRVVSHELTSAHVFQSYLTRDMNNKVYINTHIYLHIRNATWENPSDVAK